MSDHAAVPPSHVPVHRVVADVTERVIARSRETRTAYLSRISQAAAERGGRPTRADLGCSNLAHAVASCGGSDRVALAGDSAVSIGIVTSYNDMLSAHAPYETYPQQIKATARAIGGVARVAGGVPAMCDGITQGRAGMELSLFSRDVIAMSAAIALSHDAFDAALMLGVCDKIVPGLVAGALAFGHLPTAMIPAGPMSSGLPNAEKAAVRRAHAEGKVGREDLLAAEVASYHSPGTCTFYGTANSNQLLMDVMGLHLPGAAFVHPDSPLRAALTEAATRRVAEIASGDNVYGIGDIVDEKVVVNGVVALLATGGSTNHTMHLVTMAAAAGVQLTWEDFDDLSRVVPLLARMYPNGPADVNHFHAAGGTPFLVGTLVDAGLLHEDVLTLAGPGLNRYRQMPRLDESGRLVWRDVDPVSGNADVLRPVAEAFEPDGGLRMLSGTLGNAVMKVSSVARRAPRDRGAGAGVHRPGRLPHRVLPARARPGRRRRHPRPGPLGQRDARAAHADTVARRPAEARPPGRPAHRRPHVRGLRHHPGRDPPDARVGARGADLAAAGRRRRAARRRRRHAGCVGGS